MSPVDQNNLLLSILQQAMDKSVISFTAGFPAKDFFLMEEIKQAFTQVLNDPTHLQYSTDPQGYVQLREQVSQRLARKNMQVKSEEVVLTTGSAQAIDLVSRITLSPKDVVLVENPTYQEALKLFAQIDATIVSVKSDQEGMDPDDLERKINAYAPKLIYVNPIYNNPQGKVWSLERKQALLRIAHKHNVLILEDDPYSDLSFDRNKIVPSIFSFESDYNSSVVVYASTFSKTIAPALRTGFLATHARLLGKLIKMKHLSDLQSSTLNQRAVSKFLENVDLDKHIAKLTNEYKIRANIMGNYLRRELGSEVRWEMPQGGIYLWIELPQEIDTKKLLELSIQEGVSYFPGEFFFADESLIGAVRFSYTFPSREEIVDGMERFVRAYRKAK